MPGFRSRRAGKGGRVRGTPEARGDGCLARILSQAPAKPGPDYASWLVTWTRSGARDEAGHSLPEVAYQPLAERTASDVLDEDNMRPMQRLLTRHPGAPMAFAEIARRPSGFLRLRALVEYLKTQSDRPDVTNASDLGSTTAYVSPLHINEVMRGYQVEDTQFAEQEITNMRNAAREHVMRGLLGIAAEASEVAFNAATNTWLRKEYTRRRQAELVATSGSAATGSKGGQPVRPAGPGVETPAADIASQPLARSAAPERKTERPLSFGAPRVPAA